MDIIYDDDNEIIEFIAYEYFAKLLKCATKENTKGDLLLKKSGLSSLCDTYGHQLNPFSFNGQWQNDNIYYNPIKVFLEIFPKLDDKHTYLFLKNIIESVSSRDFNKEQLSNYLHIFGLELGYTESFNYSITQNSQGSFTRKSDITLLESKIHSNYPEHSRFYKEALSNLGNCEYKSCIDNCRTLYESVIKSKTSLVTDKGILYLTNEEVFTSDGIKLETKDKIFRNWIDTKKGANRYRYFTTMYSMMSGLGAHGEDVPTQRDAKMILRATEDILLWMLNDE